MGILWLFVSSQVGIGGDPRVASPDAFRRTIFGIRERRSGRRQVPSRSRNSGPGAGGFKSGGGTRVRMNWYRSAVRFSVGNWSERQLLVGQVQDRVQYVSLLGRIQPQDSIHKLKHIDRMTIRERDAGIALSLCHGSRCTGGSENATRARSSAWVAIKGVWLPRPIVQDLNRNTLESISAGFQEGSRSAQPQEHDYRERTMHWSRLSTGLIDFRTWRDICASVNSGSPSCTQIKPGLCVYSTREVAQLIAEQCNDEVWLTSDLRPPFGHDQ